MKMIPARRIYLMRALEWVAPVCPRNGAHIDFARMRACEPAVQVEFSTALCSKRPERIEKPSPTLASAGSGGCHERKFPFPRRFAALLAHGLARRLG